MDSFKQKENFLFAVYNLQLSMTKRNENETFKHSKAAEKDETLNQMIFVLLHFKTC